jgi:hypothetical protein
MDLYNYLDELNKNVPKEERMQVDTPYRPEFSFLNKIKELESSGGKNVNHATIQFRIHAGDAALGQYGLMPNTIKEVLGRGPASSEFNSDIEADAAETLAKKILNKTGGDQEKAAYMWNRGHHIDPAQISDQKLDDNFLRSKI